MTYNILDTFKEKRINSNKEDYYHLIETPYGICKVLKNNWDKGHQKPNISSALDKTQYFINMSNEIHKNKYDYSLSTYLNRKVKIKIICPTHGEFLQNPVDHLLDSGCRKCCGKDKTTVDFVLQANEIHNNKYEYEKASYINSNSKITITCKLHGDFDQIPTSHLSGVGCHICGKNRLNGKVWSITRWSEMARDSKYFDSFKVYILECFNGEEKFFKIGKTYTTIKKRFSGNKMPYNFNVVKEFIFTDALICSKYEKELHKKYKEFNYTPKIKFAGER